MQRFVRAPVLVMLAAGWLAITPTADAGPIYLVDTLGVATPTTSFSVFGAGGPSVTAEQSPGPQFTLLDNMVLTGIGAFLNNCGIFLGNPPCPNRLPYIVEIRPSIGGIPDPSTVLASFVLTDDNEPLVVSFESVRPFRLALEPGSYFALFALQQASDEAGLLGNTGPFGYVAGSTLLGFLNPLTGSSSVGPAAAAVRITAATVPEPSTLSFLGLALTMVGMMTHRVSSTRKRWKNHSHVVQTRE